MHYQNIKDINIFDKTHYIKKCVLIIEYLDEGKIDAADDIYTKYKDCIKKADSEKDLDTCLNEYLAELIAYIGEDLFDDYNLGNTDEFTNKYHALSYFNEIANDESTSDICDAFYRLFADETPENKHSKFVLSLYSFNNFELTFDTMDHMEELLNKHDITPCTAYEYENGTYVELWSI